MLANALFLLGAFSLAVILSLLLGGTVLFIIRTTWMVVAPAKKAAPAVEPAPREPARARPQARTEPAGYDFGGAGAMSR